MFGNGRLLEFDSPQALLANANSHLTLLVDQTSAAEAEHLRMLANNSRSSPVYSQEAIVENENPLEEINETDPLLTPVHTVI